MGLTTDDVLKEKISKPENQSIGTTQTKKYKQREKNDKKK